MSVFEHVVARRRFRFRTQHTLEACRQRLATNPDSQFTAWGGVDDEFRLRKTVPAAMKYLRRPTPPVVRARLTAAGRDTCVTVEGRVDYGELVSAALLALFMSIGPLLVFVVPTIQDGRPLGEIAPVFLFIIGAPTLIFGSVWIGAASRTSELAHRLAAVLEAHPDDAPQEVRP
jgi:hypothetical protein